MRRRPVVLLVAAALPLLVLGGLDLARTADRLADPCVTWGDRWGSYQEGGGTSPGPPGCEDGVSWTTQAKGDALLDALRMPVAALLALALGLAGARYGRGWPVAVAVALFALGSAPLVPSATLAAASWPAALGALAMRDVARPTIPDLWARWAVGGAAVLALVAMGGGFVRAVLVDDVPLVALAFAVPFFAGVGVVAWAGLAPRPARRGA